MNTRRAHLYAGRPVVSKTDRGGKLQSDGRRQNSATARLPDLGTIQRCVYRSFCSVRFFSRPRSDGWPPTPRTYFLRLSLSSAILIDSARRLHEEVFCAGDELPISHLNVSAVLSLGGEMPPEYQQRCVGLYTGQLGLYEWLLLSNNNRSFPHLDSQCRI